MSKVLVVSAHPDDEVLGAGGTLVRHRDQGDEIVWLIVTDIYEKDGYRAEQIEGRKIEIEKVAKKLKIKEVVHLDYPTTFLTQSDVRTLIPQISSIFNKHKPERIYVMNRSDAHSDHRVVFDAVMSCTKSFRYPYIREVLMYECISETEFAPALHENVFIPNCYIDISSQIDEKIQMMKVYDSEMGDHPFPRSERNIRALATFRGASCGVDYAEAFQIIKSYRHEKL